jgi:hypothetical protein
VKGQHYDFHPPHVDRAVWEVMMADAFATRSGPVIYTFLSHLARLCQQSYDDKAKVWVPDEFELNFAINLINSTRPRNEMEAALCAQMVAVHFMQMKVSARMLSGWGDPQMAAVAGKLSRTFAQLVDTHARLKGRKSASRQTINVRHDKHIHNHQHVHFEGGPDEFRDQPHGARAGEPAERAALPGPVTVGRDVQTCGREGHAGVPNARRRFRVRRAEG